MYVMLVNTCDSEGYLFASVVKTPKTKNFYPYPIKHYTPIATKLLPIFISFTSNHLTHLEMTCHLLNLVSIPIVLIPVISTIPLTPLPQRMLHLPNLLTNSKNSTLLPYRLSSYTYTHSPSTPSQQNPYCPEPSSSH
ncbi:MAG: hypothetical protein RMJ37_03500 [Spirochaetia bacterium]|nr:hypothetical protein [Spirochaetota bacterium]MDW8112393.1 hypothetical protein [Spirochaetia bacterium]